MRSEHRFVSFDGTPMFFRRTRPEGRFKAALVLVHGMGEHGGRYTALAEFLADRGFSCYLPDLRGFGKSGGKRGCLRRFTDYFQDLEGVCRLLRAWEPDPDPFFLGHSYGGLVVSSFLASGPKVQAKGMVLSSPNFGIAIRVPFWRHALALLGSRLLPDLTQPNRVDALTLTHDPEITRAHAVDPLIHDRISTSLYRELVARIRSSRQAAVRTPVPALILPAGGGRVVSRKATQAFYEALGSRDKQFKAYEGLYHEILNETSRKAIFEEIASWLSQRA